MHDIAAGRLVPLLDDYELASSASSRLSASRAHAGEAARVHRPPRRLVRGGAQGREDLLKQEVAPCNPPGTASLNSPGTLSIALRPIEQPREPIFAPSLSPDRRLLRPRLVAARAHPHEWIDVASEVMFDERGAVEAIRHHWRFDEAFSAFALQGLDVDGDGRYSPEELEPLAQENVELLAEYGFFTFVSTGDYQAGFAAPTNYRLDLDEGRLTLHYTLPLAQPLFTRGESSCRSTTRNITSPLRCRARRRCGSWMPRRLPARRPPGGGTGRRGRRGAGDDRRRPARTAGRDGGPDRRHRQFSAR